MTLRVGLTGNVAAGKSAVADLFRAWGATVIDADLLARAALSPGSPVLEQVFARFGPAYRRADGSLDRGRLRRDVLGDPDARAALNAIVHPEVARQASALEAAARRGGAAIVVHDIPLLFEVLQPAAFDAVVMVDAPPALRRARLVRDRGLTPTEAETLIGAQEPSDPKRARAHFVIDNDGTREQLETRAREVWLQLLARAPSA